MSMRRCLLCVYRCLLLLYPPAFRRRFAGEMVELVAAAEPGEWPFIFGDTSVAIIRCWLEPAAASSATVPAGQNAYLALGESALPVARLLQGLALSVAIILGLCYLGPVGYLQLPKCHPIAAENVWQ